MSAQSAVKNILIITDTRISGLGGSENHIRFLLTHLDREKYRFHVAELQGADKKRIAGDIIPSTWKDVQQLKFNVKRIYGYGAVKAWWCLSRYVTRENIDVVISFHEKADIINALLWCDGKTLFRVSSRRDMNINPSRLLLAIRRKLIRRYDAVTAPCQAILDLTRRVDKIPSNKLYVIYNAVDCSHFKPGNSRRQSSQTEYPESDRFVGICLGNLKQVKGHADLLDAFVRVVGEIPHAKLLLVGEDNGTGEEIRNRIALLNLTENVEMLGGRSDVATILSVCDYMVCSSLSEGLSNALLEGLSAGLPLVATDVGGNREIVQNGINGFLCPAGDVYLLSKKILSLYTGNNLTKMAEASRQMAQEKFSIERICHRYDLFFADMKSK